MRFRFRSLCLASTASRLCIPVPSRSYQRPNSQRPLNGLRFAIKDTIDLCGTPTTAGSRAYQKLHPQAATSARCVQDLTQLGAILVGKTKTAQFADGDTVTADWVEAACPWNPRGDGYLIASGSSSGSASAVATYTWLDFTLGTDSGSITPTQVTTSLFVYTQTAVGSIRGPAMWQGVYGLRPSHGALSCEGVIPVARSDSLSFSGSIYGFSRLTPPRSLDTVGFMARDLHICRMLSITWLRSLPRRSNRVTKVIQPFPFPNVVSNSLLYCTSRRLHKTC